MAGLLGDLILSRSPAAPSAIAAAAKMSHVRCFDQGRLRRALTIARDVPSKGPDLAHCPKEMERRVRLADERVRFVYFGFD